MRFFVNTLHHRYNGIFTTTKITVIFSFSEDASASLKNETTKTGEVNIKSYNQRIDKKKVKEIINK